MYKIPVLHSGGLILSYQCTNECKHCLYCSSPKWNEWISKEDLHQIIESLSQYDFYGLHLAGGEPFIKYDILLNAVELCNKYDIPLEYVETNCYWCIKKNEVYKKLTELKKAGLPGILISISPFHNEFIPLSRALLCLEVAEEVFGNNVFIYTTSYLFKLQRFNINKKIPLKNYIKTIGENNAGKDFLHNYGLILNGRAVVELEKFYPHFPPDYWFKYSQCSSRLLSPHHIHIDLYGNYIGGFCSGITLGKSFNLRELYNKKITYENFPVLFILLSKGVKGLYEFVLEKIEFTPLPQGYISPCHLCNHLRYSLIKNNFYFDELSPVEYYSFLSF